MLATFIAGISYGYLYLKTNNLWGPFLAHTINNTLLNMLYFRTGLGLKSTAEFMFFWMILLLGYLALVPLINIITKRYNLPEAKPWG
jgi:membrane protease YdiL (CAAX protease family)